MTRRQRTPATLQTLARSLPRFGDRPAVGLRRDYGARWWSYRRLLTAAEQVAEALVGGGVTPGDRVVLWAPNGPEWVAGFLGGMLAGGVVVPMDSGAPPALVSERAGGVDAVVVLHGPTQDAASLPGKAVPLAAVVAGTTSDRTPSTRCASPAVAPDDPAVILHTSGTTGEARGVVLTHRNIASHLESFAPWRHLGRLVRSRLLVASPLSHAQGLIIGLCVPLFLGVSVLYTSELDPHHLIRTIRQNRINAFLGVPRLHDLLSRELRASPSGRRRTPVGTRVDRTRWFIVRRHLLFLATHARLGYTFWVAMVGGASLRDDVERFWFDAGYVLVHGYGLTETAALVSLRVNGPFRRRPGSIGRALPHHEVAVAADGEIVVRGPAVSPGVWGELGAAAASDRPLHTGDLARLDRRGRLFFTGRRADIIVTADGSNVPAAAVESALLGGDDLRDAVVIDAPESPGEVHAVLLPERGADPAALVAAANRRLPPASRITSWSVWTGEDFPRSTLHKVIRHEVAAAADRRGTGATPKLPAGDVPGLDQVRAEPHRERRLDLLASYLAGATTPAPADAALTLFHDLGFGSLDVVELLARLERTGAARTEHLRVAEHDTVADLKARLQGDDEASRPHRSPPAMDRLLFRVVRTLLAAPVLTAWAATIARLRRRPSPAPQGLRPPLIVAVAHHRHGADALLLRRSLPWRLRRRLVVVTTEWLFQDHLQPDTGAGRLRRTFVGAAYRWGLPCLFPFAVWPGHTAGREGLLETGRLIDRGYVPLVFPEAGDDPEEVELQPGLALIADQTGATVLPARIAGNDEVTLLPRPRRPLVTVDFAAPVIASGDGDRDAVTKAVAARMVELARRR